MVILTVTDKIRKRTDIPIHFPYGVFQRVSNPRERVVRSSSGSSKDTKQMIGQDREDLLVKNSVLGTLNFNPNAILQALATRCSQMSLYYIPGQGGLK